QAVLGIEVQFFQFENYQGDGGHGRSQGIEELRRHTGLLHVIAEPGINRWGQLLTERLTLRQAAFEGQLHGQFGILSRINIGLERHDPRVRKCRFDGRWKRVILLLQHMDGAQEVNRVLLALELPERMPGCDRGVGSLRTETRCGQKNEQQRQPAGIKLVNLHECDISRSSAPWRQKTGVSLRTPREPAILGLTSMNSVSLRLVGWALALGSAVQIAGAEVPTATEVEGQPVSANVERVLQGLEILGQPLPGDAREAIAQAARNRDAQA